MIPYINDIGLSADEIDRVEELHKRFAFVVYNAGFSCTMEEGRKVEMCYWQNLRGVRQSALFPGHAAAWRDALRVHDEAVDAVKANPGVHRYSAQAMPADQAAALNGLKHKAMKAGYAFSRSRGEDFYTFDGCKVTGFKSHAECVRDAVRHWARRDPASFCAAMNLLGEGDEATGMAPDFKDWGPLSSIYDDKPMPTFTVQGKTFEEVEEDQLRAKRAYGVPQGTLEEGQLRTLECAGYKFEFTSSWGWKCEQVPYVTGALVNCIKEAWQHAIAASNDEEGMLATAKAYMEGSNEWQGIGQPPEGTVLWVIPHNTIWGFAFPGPHLCRVLAYHNDHVWLERLSDIGEATHEYTTTRIDKVDVKIWKGNKDV